MKSRRGRRCGKQSGYILLVLIFFLTLLMMAALASAPRVAQQVQRDREEEMIHRGAQYARAIKKYFKKFGRYPATIEQLESTNNIRFLRKAYKDPMMPDGKWRLLHPGEVKLGRAPHVGTPVSAMASQFGTGTGTSPGAAQQASSSNAGQSPQGSAFGASGQSTGTPGSGSTSAFGRSSGPTIGGFIIGVASASEKEGIHEFNDKTAYKDWYFVYDPTVDRGGLINGPYTGKVFAGTAGSVVGTPGTAGPGTPMGQQPSTFGQPGGLGQPSSFGLQPSSFGQPSGMGQPSGFGQPPGNPPQQQRPPQ